MSTIRVRRGLEANRLSFTPAVGEPVFTTDTKKLYVGDGSTPGGILVDMNPAIVPDLVQSVAGRTGVVVLTKADVGLSSADNTADTNKPVSAATQAALDAKATIAALTAHASNTANPHSTTKAQVGLPDVDNVSAAALRDRSTHTGTQDIASIAGLSASLAGKQPLGSYATTTELTDGLTDKADVVHTHSQADVSGLGVALDAKQDDLVSGTNIKTINGNSILGSGDLTIAGGGGGGAVDSVNGATGIVVLDADDISDAATTNKFATAAEKTKLGHISVTQAVDLDAIETNANNVPGVKTKTDFITVTQAVDLDAIETNANNVPGIKTKTDFISITQAVDLDAVETNANNVPGVKAKTDFISVTQAVDLDAIETNANNVPGIKTKTDFITVTQAVDLDTMESDIAAKQPLDSDLTSWAAITRAAGFDTFVATPSGANLASLMTSALSASKGGTGLTALSANIVSLLGAADYAAVRTLLGLVIGTNVQAYDADLSTIAGLTATTDNFLQSKSSAWASRTPAQVAADLSVEIGKLLYPVGSIYTSINSTNPNTSLGFGTWTAFGAGRVPVGFDSGQTEFDTDEETGGAKTVTLTSAEMPSHTHVQDAHTHTQNAHTHTVSRTTGAGATTNYGVPPTNNTYSSNSANAVDAATATNQNATATNQNTGGGGAHNNLQPYIVVRMWKRTA